MKKGFVLLFAVVFALVLFQGCKGKGPADSSKVLAVVNGEKITESDLQAEIEGKPDNFKKMIENPEGKRMFVNRLVERKLLMQEAEKEGIADSPEVQKRLEAYKERLVMEQLRKKVSAAPKELTDQDLEAYYNQNKSQYSNPEMARLRKIVVADKAAADKVLRELKQPGARFEDMARRYSEDPTSKNRGGDIGFVTKDGPASRTGKGLSIALGNALPPEVSARVFALKKDEVSPAFNIEGKFVIFQMVEHRPAQDKTFEQVKEQIKRSMEFEGSQTQWKAYLEGLKKNAKIELKGELAKPATPALPKPPQSPPAPMSTPLQPQQQGK